MRIRSMVAGVMISSSILMAGCACLTGKPASAAPQQNQVSITADSMACNKETGMITAQGNVKIHTSDGAIIQTEKAVITPAEK